MRVVRSVVSVLLLALILVGCAREERKRVAAPDPTAGSKQEPRVADAHWVEGPDLARAVSLASSHPLVERAFAAAADPRLFFVPSSAVQAAGAVPGGEHVRVTILPYASREDPTFATYITLVERTGRALAIRWDFIEGRLPTPLETGFEPVDLSGRKGWVRQHEGYILATGRSPLGAPERFNFPVFARCVEQHAPPLCAAGAAVGGTIGGESGPPGAVAGGAIGCGVGAAIAVIGCGFEATK
ncbi:MAG TPA: hypothetical protein VID50_09700 [Candidatus Eisenbacteria bacterium]|jgi:hypothetical protein